MDFAKSKRNFLVLSLTRNFLLSILLLCPCDLITRILVLKFTFRANLFSYFVASFIALNLRLFLDFMHDKPSIPEN